MLADIYRQEEQYIARFQRPLKHSVQEVWAYLTDNEKLPLWFSELRMVDLREGGVIRFDMQDGTHVDMNITALEPLSVLEYTWGEDFVRFELSANAGGCLLVIKETLHELTPHTPRDLAGWHVCLNVIECLLDGTVLPSRKEQWNSWYEKYSMALQELEPSS